MIFREENLIETISDKNLTIRADALLIQKNEAIVIDWKTAQNAKSFHPERLREIEEQLKRYGESLKSHIPKVTLVAIGIFRDETLEKNKKVQTLFKKEI